MLPKSKKQPQKTYKDFFVWGWGGWILKHFHNFKTKHFQTKNFVVFEQVFDLNVNWYEKKVPNLFLGQLHGIRVLKTVQV